MFREDIKHPTSGITHTKQAQLFKDHRKRKDPPSSFLNQSSSATLSATISAALLMTFSGGLCPSMETGVACPSIGLERPGIGLKVPLGGMLGTGMRMSSGEPGTILGSRPGM